MYSYKKIIYVVLTVIVFHGCTTDMKEGFKEGWNATYVGDDLAIRFGCTQKTYLTASKEADESNISIKVHMSPYKDEPYIGYSKHKLLVKITGSSPSSVVSADIKELLVHHGHKVVEESQLAHIIINPIFVGIRSDQVSGFTQIKTKSHVGLTIRAIQKDEVVWSKEFVESDEQEGYTAVYTEMGEGVDRAYCKVLEDIDKALLSKEFQTVINREVQ